MTQPIEMVTNCDGCPLKIPADPCGDEYYCNYGTYDQYATSAPQDCDLRKGDVIVRLKVRR